jgi:hypothetical protein
MYFLDTEFNEFGGDLISLALVREDGKSIYIVDECPNPGPWVAEHVIPILGAAEVPAYAGGFGHRIAEFLRGDSDPVIITDWPEDIRHFCQVLITRPGQMVAVPRLQFALVRVDAYPTTLPGAVQHNAWWDAMALRHLFVNPSQQ